VPARVIRGDAARRDLLRHPDRRTRIGDQGRSVAFPDAYRPPAIRAEAGGGPAGRFKPEVVALSHQQVGALDRAGRGPPLPVGADPLTAAVGVGDAQLGQQFGSLQPEPVPASSQTRTFQRYRPPGASGAPA